MKASQLRRGSPLLRATFLRRAGRLRQVGRRAARAASARSRFRAAILARCHADDKGVGTCERCSLRRKLHAHHVRPLSRGGSNEPENGVGLCFRCHREVHDHRGDWRRWVK